MVDYVEAMLIDGDDRVLLIALYTLRNALLRRQRSSDVIDASGIN
jgi:hypothetical protein